MKIAITSTGKNLDSLMDPRFGRAPYIVIASSDGDLLEVIDNAVNVNAMRGAGIQAAKSLADRGVDVLLTGHCGPNAFTALQAAGHQRRYRKDAGRAGLFAGGAQHQGQPEA